MPELPDVEVFRQYIDATSLHQEIKGVDVRSQQVLEGLSVEELTAQLEGRSFESTNRHGKHLFVALDKAGYLMLHFGMTGNLVYFKHMEKDPPHDRLLFTFANGYHLAYDSMRKLGEVQMVDSIESFVAEKELGPDALDPDLDLPAFRDRVADRQAMIKPTLMDQESIAGIGNVYADEILFQAEVHPRTNAKDLAEETLDGIFRQMKDVLRTAIDRNARPEDFPDSYVTPHRHEGGRCPICGTELQRVKVSGRSAYFCPNRQRKK